MRYKVGDWVRVKYVSDGDRIEVGEIGTIVFCDDDLRVYAVEFTEYSRGKHSCNMHCKDGFGWWCKEEMLELFARCKFKTGDRVRVKDTGDWDSDIITIGETGTIIEYSISDKVYRVEFDNYNMYKHDCGGRCRKGYGWNCEEKMLEPVEYVFSLKEAEELTRVIYADGGLIPTPSKPVSIEEQLVKDTFKDCLDSAFEAWRRLGGATNIFFKEDKPMKFTFYTKEGYRIDKSNNSKVETITTYVNGILFSGEATCDKTDYDERQGVLEALANAVSDGDFDKIYKKAVKANKRADEVKRTCKYCGKTFNTIEEKEAEEAWHVERRKARHERYLLRKRAKEIAFENAAQKLAKEMVDLK